MCPTNGSPVEAFPTDDGTGTGGAMPTERSHNISLRLPPYTPSDPQLWFAIIESKFKIAGITDEGETSNYMISVWDQTHLVEVKDIN